MDRTALVVGYIGNFGPSHSTENEVRKAFTALGHEVVPLQENDAATWTTLLNPPPFDLVLWTRTWHLPEFPQLEALDVLAMAGIPTAAFHLDRWHDLNREHQVVDEPMFRCAFVFTADGGHEPEFAAAGVNHRWLPPAVSEFECLPAAFDRRVASDVAFVGTQSGYHAEWTHRPELIGWLRRNYRGRFRAWPVRGAPAVRRDALRVLYASVKVVVGDSCLVPTSRGPIERYWSDRIPETLGRGAFLLHPHVDGLDEQFDLDVDGGHLQTWHAGDWSELHDKIDWWLAHDDERRAMAERGRAHVLTHHTYTHRAQAVLDEVFA